MPSGAPTRSRAVRSLRPFWLIPTFYIICLVVLALLEAAGSVVAGSGVTNPREAPFQWLALSSVVVATWVVLMIEKQPWSFVSLGRDGAAPGVLANGALIGAATIGTASLTLLATHMLRIDATVPGSWWGAAGRSALMLLPAAFFEELFIRGFAFAVLRRAGGWRLALIVTSVVFGLLHAWNPGADAESILAVIVAGFFLGGILLASGSLYAAGAAHFAWNWVMAGALHIPVSGIPSMDPGYRTVETGPDWLTGGPWGPEGGLAAVAAMFVAIFYLYGRYLRRMELKG
ncbi:MAG TPA: type II CAAX endopeptidase family protein [Gemmatimonadaceae bacterium]|nr:type II CAAX endopeptidase family protein [Gemmatimonadaceae bacterium]